MISPLHRGDKHPLLIHNIQCPEFSLQFTPMDIDGHFHFLQTITNLRETPPWISKLNSRPLLSLSLILLFLLPLHSSYYISHFNPLPFPTTVWSFLPSPSHTLFQNLRFFYGLERFRIYRRHYVEFSLSEGCMHDQRTISNWWNARLSITTMFGKWKLCSRNLSERIFLNASFCYSVDIKRWLLLFFKVSPFYWNNFCKWNIKWC